MDEWLNRQIVNLVPMGIVSSNLTSFNNYCSDMLFIYSQILGVIVCVF